MSKLKEIYCSAKKAQELVQKTTYCHVCGEKFLYGHIPDFKNLLIQENRRCPICDDEHQQSIHLLN